MADTAARLALVVRRYEVARFTIVVRGIDLSDAAPAMQVRLQRGTPGAPLIALGTVTTTAAEGLKLDSVTMVDGVPVSIIKGRINQSTMSDGNKVPFLGELGDDTTLAYAMQWTLAGDAQTRIEGDLIVRDSAFGSDNAPAGRPAGYGAQQVASGGSGALTFGDQVIAVSIDGLDVIAPYAARAETAASDAQAAAQQAQTLAGSIVPYGAVTNNGAVDGRTHIAASFAAPPFGAGSLLDLFIPSDVLGPVSLKVDQLGDAYVRILDENAAELTGVAFPAGSVVRLKLNLDGFVWLTVSETPGLDYIRGIGSDASGAKNTLEAVYGLPLALPIAGDPNRLAFSSAPPPANGAPFETIITVTNTGQAFIYANGPYLRIVQNAGGSDVVEGDLAAGTVVTMVRSDEGGAVAVIVGRRPLVQDAVPPPIASRAQALVEQPWGAITFPNGGHAQVAPVDVPLVVIGSSNGHPDYVAAGAVPADVLVSALNGYTPGSSIRFLVDNAATPGAPWTDAGRQLGTSAAFTQGRARLVASIFGMNEARSTFYHDYGGLPAQERAVRDSVAYIRSMGAEPVLNTIFHCDPRDMSGLEPNYFADNAGRDMVYPAFKAHPVSPTLDMVPPSTGLATEPLDWTGGGVLRTGSMRLWDSNRMFRRVAAELGCKLLDFEWLCFRACIETVPDLSDALDLFYARGNPLHPLKPLYDRVVAPILRQLARALVDGRDDIRVFRGTDA